MAIDTKAYIAYWADRYRRELTDNVLPFWLNNGLDRVHGGMYTCLTREGKLMDSTKSVWFQGRAAYTFAYAYNAIEPRAEWLEAAKSCIDFSHAHCYRQHDGRMYFEVAADGTPIRLRRYVFSETFAIIAMAEYAKATGDKQMAERALALFKQVREWIATGALPNKYEGTPGRSHSIVMILLNVAARLRQVSDDPVLDQQIADSIAELRTYFMKPEYGALLESVGPDGEFIDTIGGRTINPGHCIETAWFLLDEVVHRGGDTALQAMALTILDWSWEWGWDKLYGGIINFRDCKGYPPQDYSQDMKFWWPQTEAIIATLYAYKLTRDEKYLRWHEQVSDWAFAHFADAEHGEWYGYLHRDGSVAQDAKGNIFKGPFHLPRMLTKGYELCQELLSELD